MEYSLGDLLDRKGIVELKMDRGSPAPHQRELLKKELDTIKKELRNTTKNDVISYFAAMIKDSNEKIWNLESDIRKGKENTIPLRELEGLTTTETKNLEVIGQSALQIREHNKKRIKFKNETNKKFNKGFQEIKLKHASER